MNKSNDNSPPSLNEARDHGVQATSTFTELINDDAFDAKVLALDVEAP